MSLTTEIIVAHLQNTAAALTLAADTAKILVAEEARLRERNTALVAALKEILHDCEFQRAHPEVDIHYRITECARKARAALNIARL